MGVVTTLFTYKLNKLLLCRELGCVQIFIICITIARRSIPHTYGGPIHLLRGDSDTFAYGRGVAGSSVYELRLKLSYFRNPALHPCDGESKRPAGHGRDVQTMRRRICEQDEAAHPQ